jgi:hypothetical protein
MHVLRTRSLDHTITCLRNLHKYVPLLVAVVYYPCGLAV